MKSPVVRLLKPDAVVVEPVDDELAIALVAEFAAAVAPAGLMLILASLPRRLRIRSRYRLRRWPRWTATSDSGAGRHRLDCSIGSENRRGRDPVVGHRNLNREARSCWDLGVVAGRLRFRPG